MGDTDFGELLANRVTDADFNDIMSFMLKDFLHNEPLNRSISLSESDAKQLFVDLIHNGITSSLSYVLRAPNGQIAALRLATILDRPDKNEKVEVQNAHDNNPSGDNNNHLRPTTQKFGRRAQRILDILNELDSKIWILVNPRLTRLLSWTVISVDSCYTRRGLAAKLLTYNLDEAQLMGCQGCISEATAYNSQQLFVKLGYEVIHELKHDEWLDKNGQQIFKCSDRTNSTKLVFKAF